MLKAIFDKIFSLPPVEKRHMWLTYTPFRRFFAEPTFRTDKDDTYIYYLCSQWSFIISLALGLLNLASHHFNMVFDFFFFQIDLTGNGFLPKFLTTYTLYTTPIMFLVVMPFYVIFYLKHIDIKNFDVTWWTGKVVIAPKIKNKFTLLFFGFFFLTSFCCIGMLGTTSFGWLWWHNSIWDISNSLPILLFWIFFCALYTAGISRVYLAALMQLTHNYYRFYSPANSTTHTEL